MQPGNVAQDGTDRDSPYTKGLAETILKPGPDVFRFPASETVENQALQEPEIDLGGKYHL